MENREIEVKFLEVDKPGLIEKLKSLGALDLGEELITEQIFHDAKGEWWKQHKFGRIRKTGKRFFFTFKHSQERTATGVQEIEFEITQPEKMKAFLEALGLVMDREQEKYRHKFSLGEVVVDIDTWPTVPTYVELEGPSEDTIKNAAKKLGFDYTKGVFGTAAEVLQEVYNLDIPNIRIFTFAKVK